MEAKRRVRIEEALEEIGIARTEMIRFIQKEWVIPVSQEFKELQEFPEFDVEDIARARFIRDLRRDFGVNDEAIPIILHLLDQIHRLESLLGNLKQ